MSGYVKQGRPRKTVQLSAYYDATGRSNEVDWPTYPSYSEDLQFTSAQRWIAISRLRREIRNNPFLAALISKYPEAVGTSHLRSKTSSREYNHAKDLAWWRWSKRAIQGGMPLRTGEAVILSETAVTGEVFAILLRNGKIQLVPSEFCGSPIGGGRRQGEMNGIVYGQRGRPVSYRFGRTDGNGVLRFDNPEEVSARHVKHVYLRDRVMMGRGLPWLIASLDHARKLYQICRSKTKQIQDANSISGFIKTTSPAGAGRFQGYRPGGDPIDDVKSSADDPADSTPTKIELAPGTFITLEPDEEIEALTTQYHASDYKELVMIMLHAISSPVGLPVELWFSGLGDVNYSGFKGLGVQWDSRRQYVIDQVVRPYLDGIHFWRVSKWENEGELPPNPDGDHDLYDLRFRRTAVLDDEKAAKANKTRIESGEKILPELWEDNGDFVEEVFENRRQAWIKMEVAAGNLAPDGDHSAVIVPREFLLRGQLPGESKAATPPDDEPDEPAKRTNEDDDEDETNQN